MTAFELLVAARDRVAPDCHAVEQCARRLSAPLKIVSREPLSDTVMDWLKAGSFVAPRLVVDGVVTDIQRIPYDTYAVAEGVVEAYADFCEMFEQAAGVDLLATAPHCIVCRDPVCAGYHDHGPHMVLVLGPPDIIKE